MIFILNFSALHWLSPQIHSVSWWRLYPNHGLNPDFPHGGRKSSNEISPLHALPQNVTSRKPGTAATSNPGSIVGHAQLPQYLNHQLIVQLT